MRVEIVEVAFDAPGREWDAFLDSHEHGSFYHRYGWRRLNEVSLCHTCIYLEARVDGSVTGILPLVLTKSRIFGRILCSLPFVNYGGPVAVNAKTMRLLVEAAQEHAARLCVDYLELRSAAPLDIDLPVSLHKVSMTIELESDPDHLWNRFSPKHRKNIRRVYKDDLAVMAGGQEHLSSFYSVMARSWRDLGTPLYAPEYFQAIVRGFPGQTRIFVCHRNNEPIAAALVGYDGGTVEGMWAGTSPTGQELNANYVLYWEMIKDSCERGYRRFHLGRSTAGSGAEQFKRKWNAEPTQLYWYFHRPDGNQKPVVNVDNPKFRVAIAAWRKLPLWATRVLGPPLARVIP